MRKRAIFEDIVSIMTHDSSTIKDRKGCDPEPFREMEPNRGHAC